ncbi:MAG: hypothetical protein DMG74_00640 [Acidobacteria bacterium]|nr:MAG: hypothetical protein DMG74_00640 [Acidobacteriota bacterium]
MFAVLATNFPKIRQATLNCQLDRGLGITITRPRKCCRTRENPTVTTSATELADRTIVLKKNHPSERSVWLGPIGRDARVDALRGFLLVLIMVNHLPRHPLHRFVSQVFGFVSVAEGFVFMSGLVTGMVYGRTLVKSGRTALRHRALRRARDLYLAHLCLYSFALLAGLWGGLSIAPRFSSLWTAWWHGATLIYQPNLFDILPMYCVFLLLVPFVVEQMARGRNVLVWLFSITLWLLAQWGIGGPAHNPSWLNLGFFNILAWQLLFVAGAYFGYRKATGQPSPVPASRLLFTFCLVVVIVLFTLRHQGVLLGRTSPLFNTEIMLQEWRSINHPFRLINFAAYAYILWYLPRSVDQRFHQLSLSRFLRYLGRHSLQVFVWSIFLSYVAFSFKQPWHSLSPVWQILFVLGSTLSLVLPAWVHEHWQRTAAVRNSIPRLSPTVAP